MNQIKRSALVGYSPEHMFDLVNDIQSYPEFLDGCVATELLEQTENYVMAKMHLKKAGIGISTKLRKTGLLPVHFFCLRAACIPCIIHTACRDQVCYCAYVLSVRPNLYCVAL